MVTQPLTPLGEVLIGEQDVAPLLLGNMPSALRDQINSLVEERDGLQRRQDAFKHRERKIKEETELDSQKLVRGLFSVVTDTYDYLENGKKNRSEKEPSLDHNDILQTLESAMNNVKAMTKPISSKESPVPGGILPIYPIEEHDRFDNFQFKILGLDILPEVLSSHTIDKKILTDNDFLLTLAISYDFYLHNKIVYSELMHAYIHTYNSIAESGVPAHTFTKDTLLRLCDNRAYSQGNLSIEQLKKFFMRVTIIKDALKIGLNEIEQFANIDASELVGGPFQPHTSGAVVKRKISSGTKTYVRRRSQEIASSKIQSGYFDTYINHRLEEFDSEAFHGELDGRIQQADLRLVELNTRLNSGLPLLSSLIDSGLIDGNSNAYGTAIGIINSLNRPSQEAIREDDPTSEVSNQLKTEIVTGLATCAMPRDQIQTNFEDYFEGDWRESTLETMKSKSDNLNKAQELHDKWDLLRYEGNWPEVREINDLLMQLGLEGLDRTTAEQYTGTKKGITPSRHTRANTLTIHIGREMDKLEGIINSTTGNRQLAAEKFLETNYTI